MSPTQEEQVLHAGALVAQALLSGPWPSPMRPINQENLQDEFFASYTQHQAHMSTVGASVQQFCKDTVFPSMNRAICVDKPFSKGPLIGTLILLREVLMQNANTIFGLSMTSDNNKFVARVLATSVVLHSIEHEGATTRRRFNDSMDAYDSGDNLFSIHLADPIEPSTKPTSSERSFHLHAKQHPLRCGQTYLAIPEANSAHVTVLQDMEQD